MIGNEINNKTNEINKNKYNKIIKCRYCGSVYCIKHSKISIILIKKDIYVRIVIGILV